MGPSIARTRSLFGSLPLSRKILLISAVSSLSTLIAITGISFYREWSLFKTRKVSDLSTLARILESNTVASLRFDDPYTAKEYAESLKHESDIESVSIFDPEGQLFAYYSRSGTAPEFPAPDFQGERWQKRRLLYARNIVLNGNPIGALLIEMDTASFRSSVRNSLWTAGALLFGGLAIALFLSARLQRLITQPVDELLAVTKLIASKKDYGERAKKRYQDEIGSLVDSFNAMLETVSKSDASLREINANLEKVVEERTADLRARNAALKEAIEAANAAAVAKSEFLAATSHELRTPLNPILGYVEVLLRENPPEATAQKLNYIKQSGKLLLGLIDDILEFNRLERSIPRLKERPVRYQQLCQDVIGLMAPEAAKKSLEISYRHFPANERDSEDLLLFADENRVRQVLLNLVGNALKFTRSGSIEARTSIKDFDGSKGVLRIEIEDTGIGIAPEDVHKLFKPFSQIDGSLTREHGGMGLGLAISRKIAESMSGSLNVTSSPCQGSCFRFDMPFEVAPTDTADHAIERDCLSKPGEQKPILLVEDEPINRELVRFLLTSMGYRVTAARDGVEALQRFAQEPFSLVFMDISMPRMDGYAASREIRKLDRPGSRVPIIAMTAHITSTSREKCFEVGMDGFLSKPLNFSKLESTLSEWLAPASASER